MERGKERETIAVIREPERYRVEEEKARAEYLRRLSVEESVFLLESLLTSGLAEEFSFADQRPVALAVAIKRQRGRKRV